MNIRQNHAFSHLSNHRLDPPTLNYIMRPRVSASSAAAVESRQTINQADNFFKLSLESRILFIISCFLMTLEIFSTIFVLQISKGTTCDSPLKIFLSIYALRVLISFPFIVYSSLNPLELNPTSDNLSRLKITNRIREYIDAFHVVWFLLGNYWIYRSKTCADTCPAVYTLSIAFILFGYFVLALPVLVLALIVLFVPVMFMATNLLSLCGLVPSVSLWEFDAAAAARMGRPRLDAYGELRRNHGFWISDAEKTGMAQEEIDLLEVVRFSKNCAVGIGPVISNDALEDWGLHQTTGLKHKGIMFVGDEDAIRRASDAIDGANRQSDIESGNLHLKNASRNFIRLPRILNTRHNMRINSVPEYYHKYANTAQESEPSVRNVASCYEESSQPLKTVIKTATINPSEILSNPQIETQKMQNNTFCVICLNEYSEGDLLRKLPCGHCFHVKCIDEWLYLKKTCPLCKKDATSLTPTKCFNV